MKKISVFIILTITLVFAQNLYFLAFTDIQKAKRVLNSNPDKAKNLFIEAKSYLKEIVNSSIDKTNLQHRL
jgi:archaellum component FlaF (FlaF/FlaG flagellin family)